MKKSEDMGKKVSEFRERETLRIAEAVLFAKAGNRVRYMLKSSPLLWYY